MRASLISARAEIRALCISLARWMLIVTRGRGDLQREKQKQNQVSLHDEEGTSDPKDLLGWPGLMLASVKG